jgi:hypothetical protein
MYTQAHTRARQQGYSGSDSKYGGSDIKIRSTRYPITDMVLKSMRAAWGWICGAKSPKLNDKLIFTLSTGSNWMNYQSCCKTGSDLLDPCHCKRKKQTRVGQSGIWAKSGDVIAIFLHLFSCCGSARHFVANLRRCARAHQYTRSGTAAALPFN